MLSDERLRECPFCNGAPSLVGSGPYRVSCACGVSGPLHYTITTAEAIAAWNRRAAEQQEPVAWQWQMIEGEANLWFVTNDADIAEKQRRDGHKLVPLFASPQPPQQEPVGDPKRTKGLTINLTEEEMDALERLSEKQELSKQRLFVQALRLYQATVFPVDLGPMLDPSLASPQPPVPAGVSVEYIDGWWYVRLGNKTVTSVINEDVARELGANLEAALLNGGSNGR